VEQAVSAMGRISESSGEISDIISLIDGIAFQTNLLALNAAVEAARAGDQGRGFAVVAGEVRTLAQRSAEAAKEIKALIETTAARVDEGSKLVNSSGGALEKIQSSIMKVSSVASEMAEAAREQSRGIDQVNLAVSQLDSVNQENAALVEETAAASSSLSEQAIGLSSVVSTFKLSQRTADSSQQRSSYNQEISNARSAHLAWKGKIRGFLDGMTSMDESEAVSHHDCALGKWLDREARKKYAHLGAMEILDREHEKLHHLIRDIVQSKNRGDLEGVEQLYQQIEPITAEVLLQLDEIDAAASAAAEENRSVTASSSARPATRPAAKPVMAEARVKPSVQQSSTGASRDSEWAEF